MSIFVAIDVVNRITGEQRHFEGEGLEASNDAMVEAREWVQGEVEWFTPDDFPPAIQEPGRQEGEG